MAAPRPRVLCVDDEPNVLEGLELHLARKWEVVTATGGALGLRALADRGPFAVVLSDMRMPEMDGATFLGKAREASPESVRLLLTGQADLDAAIAAVNEGQIFRFLTKPCPPPRLLGAVQAAVEQHDLITAERVLLQQTLRGAIQALTDVLALANPQAFGRATRLRKHVSELAGKLGIREAWPLEVAAMLSQIGCVTLPAEVVEKLHLGLELPDNDRRMVARLPELADRLLQGIPRIEAVRGILARHAAVRPKAPARTDDIVAIGGEALRIATDFDTLEARGLSTAHALDTLRGRAEAYDAALLDALVSIHAQGQTRQEVRELPIRAVVVGMVFAEDVRLQNGTLFVTRGYEVTQSFVERVRNFMTGAVKEPVRVIVTNANKAPSIRDPSEMMRT